MGFYGNITNASNTSFSFDKIYPNRFIMDSKCGTDGISVGRFVLVEYETEAVVGSGGSLKPKEVTVSPTENGNFIASFNGETLKFVENKTNKEQEVTYGEVVKTQHNGENIYLICIGGTEEVEPIAVFNDLAISDETFTTYNINYQTDFSKYMKNYDSTVWTKTATEEGFKYVQVAELNGVVPTFALSVEAPTEMPLAPYFDGDSTNVYYDLHVQPSWGFRVAAAADGAPSDEFVEYEKNKLDIKENKNIIQVYCNFDQSISYPVQGGDTALSNLTAGWYQTKWVDGKRYVVVFGSDGKEYYLDPENEKIYNAIEKQKHNADIYYNKAGFEPKTRSHVEDIDNNISITADGYSGKEYEIADLTTDRKEQAPDIQQLHIILPSIGNTISDIWDIVYGEDRYQNIDWIDLSNTEDIKKEYDLNTIAGCINSAHTLMGEIIKTVELTEGTPIILEKTDYLKSSQVNSSLIEENVLYKIVQNNKNYFYRAYKKPVFEEAKEVIEGETYYVTGIDTSEVSGYSVGDKWNTNFLVIPKGVTLSKHVRDKNGNLLYDLCYKKVPMVNDHIVSLYGWILKLDEIINGSSDFDRDDKSVKGVLNSIKDLVSLFDAERLMANALVTFNASGKISPMELDTAQDGSYTDWGDNETVNFDNKDDFNRWIKHNYNLKAEEYIGFKKYFAENFGALLNYFNYEVFTEGGALYVLNNLKEKTGSIAFNDNKEKAEYVLTKESKNIVCIYDKKGKKVREVLLAEDGSNEQGGLVLQYITDANEKIVPYPYADGLHADDHGQYIFHLGKHRDGAFPDKINVYENIDTLQLIHNHNEVEDKTSELNFNNIDDSSFEIPLPIVDSMGHIVGKHTKEVTLPYGYSHIKAGENSVDPEMATDTLNIAGNDWIEISGNVDDDKKEIVVAHKTKTNNSDEFSVFNHGADQQVTTPRFEIDAAGHLKQSGTNLISTKQDFSYINLGTGKIEKEDAKEGTWIDLDLYPQFSFVDVNVNEYKVKFVTGKLRDLFYFNRSGDMIVGVKVLDEDEINTYATKIEKYDKTYVFKINKVEDTGEYTYDRTKGINTVAYNSTVSTFYPIESFLGLSNDTELSPQELEEAKDRICSVFLCNEEVYNKIYEYENPTGTPATLKIKETLGAGLHIGHNHNRVEDTTTYSYKTIPDNYNYLGEMEIVNELYALNPNIKDLVQLKSNYYLKDDQNEESQLKVIKITDYFSNLFFQVEGAPGQYYFQGGGIIQETLADQLQNYTAVTNNDITYTQIYCYLNKKLQLLTEFAEVLYPEDYIGAPNQIQLDFVTELDKSLPFSIYIVKPGQYSIVEDDIKGYYWFTGEEWVKPPQDFMGNGLNANQSELNLYTPIVDSMGHIVGTNTELVTLPKGYGNIDVKGYYKDVKPLKATSYEDGLLIEADNQWIDLSAQSNTSGNMIKIGHKLLNENIVAAANGEVVEGRLKESDVPLVYSKSLLPKVVVNDNKEYYYSVLDYFDILEKNTNKQVYGTVIFDTVEALFVNPERYGEIDEEFIRKYKLQDYCQINNTTDKEGNSVTIYTTNIYSLDLKNEKGLYIQSLDRRYTLTNSEENIYKTYGLKSNRVHGFIFVAPGEYNIINHIESNNEKDFYYVHYVRGEGKNYWETVSNLEFQESTYAVIPSVTIDNAGHISNLTKYNYKMSSTDPSLIIENFTHDNFTGGVDLPNKKTYFNNNVLKLNSINKWVQLDNTKENTIEIMHSPTEAPEDYINKKLNALSIKNNGALFSTYQFTFDAAGHIGNIEKLEVQNIIDNASITHYQNRNQIIDETLVCDVAFGLNNFGIDIDVMYLEDGSEMYYFTESFKNRYELLENAALYGVYYIDDNQNIKKLGTVAELYNDEESVELYLNGDMRQVYISDYDLNLEVTPSQLKYSIRSQDIFMDIISKLENRILDLEKQIQDLRNN